jgi:hypothetical protein
LLSNFRDQNVSADDKATADCLAVDSALNDAVNIKLETRERPSAVDLAQIRDILRALLEALDNVRADEVIKADRAAHVLLKDLADVYFERAGSAPSTAPDGPFRHATTSRAGPLLFSPNHSDSCARVAQPPTHMSVRLTMQRPSFHGVTMVRADLALGTLTSTEDFRKIEPNLALIAQP